MDSYVIRRLLLTVFVFLQDLNRQVVKSDAASFTVPELEFESPAFSQKGGKRLQLPFVLFGGRGVRQQTFIRINISNITKINLSASQFTNLCAFTLHCLLFNIYCTVKSPGYCTNLPSLWYGSPNLMCQVNLWAFLCFNLKFNRNFPKN